MKNKKSFYRVTFDSINKRRVLNIMWIISIIKTLSLLLSIYLITFNNENVEKILLFTKKYMEFLIFVYIIASVFWIYNFVVCIQKKDKFSHIILLLFFGTYYAPIYYFFRIYLKSNSLNNSVK